MQHRAPGRTHKEPRGERARERESQQKSTLAGSSGALWRPALWRPGPRHKERNNNGKIAFGESARALLFNSIQFNSARDSRGSRGSRGRRAPSLSARPESQVNGQLAQFCAAGSPRQPVAARRPLEAFGRRPQWPVGLLRAARRQQPLASVPGCSPSISALIDFEFGRRTPEGSFKAGQEARRQSWRAARRGLCLRRPVARARVLPLPARRNRKR